MKSLIGYKNAGYKIIKVFIMDYNGIDTDGVVIGRKIDGNLTCCPYVTWSFTIRGDNPVPNFYWGHYVDTEESAFDEAIEKCRRFII